MTRKDYKLVAEVIRMATIGNVNKRIQLAAAFATAFEKEHSNFNRGHFFEACGV